MAGISGLWPKSPSSALQPGPRRSAASASWATTSPPLNSPSPPGIDPTASRPEVTAAVTRGAVRVFRGLGYVALAEVTLPNARRADLMAISPRGELFIAEVKSSLEDFRVDRKWRDYLDFCDRFAFAVSPEFPQHELPQEPGLLVCDGFGGALVREAPLSPLAGSRRKALTIAFARLAALRASGVLAVDLEV
ncbi:MAG: MmcB family DNA repair protein [Phenylobacterium sp.]|nr:MmcB family DNA repair protein [Phenylobacterium sp.]MCA3735867.1 MmcB family DNA repair protein [Phenylobacterium sp.]MCA3755943.1 MmcB family DNA repair protein [Phenylobacterium sp.]MCA6229980.1 MmcB family DNA repair protein [Phenylobacterium sp.]MCA6272374.1 MmcB family DNA repair protein [Phenylobacterium sp.]